MSKVGCNLISERHLALMTGQLFFKSPWYAHLDVGEDSCHLFDFNEASRHYEMKAKRGAGLPERLMLESTPSQRSVMEGSPLDGPAK